MPDSASLPDPRASTDVKHLPVSPLPTRTFVQDVGHRSDIVLHSLDDLQGAVLDIESSFLPVVCRSDLSTRSAHICGELSHQPNLLLIKNRLTTYSSVAAWKILPSSSARQRKEGITLTSVASKSALL
jgi:hypothetical protein